MLGPYRENHIVYSTQKVLRLTQMFNEIRESRFFDGIATERQREGELINGRISTWITFVYSIKLEREIHNLSVPTFLRIPPCFVTCYFLNKLRVNNTRFVGQQFSEGKKI